ncbi:hypothetical protein MesoLjLa_30890 [Mesorhizobium sp. L-2-11]|nr:hypothetical protein MesoLjLa_30890 [Mesorhizobium sp. L-2-11]
MWLLRHDSYNRILSGAPAPHRFFKTRVIGETSMAAPLSLSLYGEGCRQAGEGQRQRPEKSEAELKT